MRIVEGTPYKHDVYGRVRVQLVTDECVFLHVVDERIPGTGQPRCECQPVEAFRAGAEPGAQGVALPAAQVDAEEPMLGDSQS